MFDLQTVQQIFFLLNMNVYLENNSVKPAEIKIIDFGSACTEDRTVYSYIQVHAYDYCQASILNLSCLYFVIMVYSHCCCRVVIIGLQKFFLDISILLNEIQAYSLVSLVFFMNFGFCFCVLQVIAILLIFLLVSSNVLFFIFFHPSPPLFWVKKVRTIYILIRKMNTGVKMCTQEKELNMSPNREERLYMLT